MAATYAKTTENGWHDEAATASLLTDDMLVVDDEDWMTLDFDAEGPVSPAGVTQFRDFDDVCAGVDLNR